VRERTTKVGTTLLKRRDHMSERDDMRAEFKDLCPSIEAWIAKILRLIENDQSSELALHDLRFAARRTTELATLLKMEVQEEERRTYAMLNKEEYERTYHDEDEGEYKEFNRKEMELFEQMRKLYRHRP
jgi:hypothetical protein